MHRIRRQNLSIELPREAGAADASRRAARLVQEKTLPRLEALFDRLGPAGVFVRLEKVEIDLGDLEETSWETDFVDRSVEQIARQIERQIFEIGPNGHSESTATEAEKRATIIFWGFLKTGATDWAARGESIRSVEAAVLEAVLSDSANFRRRLADLFLEEKGAMKRLVWQFAPSFSRAVLEAVFDRKIEATAFERWAKKAATLSKNAFFDAFFKENEAETAFSKNQKVEAANGDEPSFFRKKAAEKAEPTAPKKPRAEAASEGFLIENAGVVLVAPFLPRLFSRLGWTAENGLFRDDFLQRKAARGLHFLATGASETVEEPVLFLPKILCGLAIDEPIESEIGLSSDEKMAIEKLLEAIIGHWPALKNTSADGLRAAFLQRNGLVEWQKSRAAWLLRIERKGQDVLLERLGWGFSIVKFEWMAAMLQTEW